MGPFRIMVVDDEEDFLETIVKRLRRRRVDVTGVESGLEALRKLEEEPFDVVILDVKMPGMDGIDVLKRIKKRWPRVEVIMLTGHASVESGIQGLQHGAFDYVMKPAELDDLMEKVRRAHQRKLRREASSPDVSL